MKASLDEQMKRQAASLGIRDPKVIAAAVRAARKELATAESTPSAPLSIRPEKRAELIRAAEREGVSQGAADRLISRVLKALAEGPDDESEETAPPTPAAPQVTDRRERSAWLATSAPRVRLEREIARMAGREGDR